LDKNNKLISVLKTKKNFIFKYILHLSILIYLIKIYTILHIFIFIFIFIFDTLTNLNKLLFYIKKNNIIYKMLSLLGISGSKSFFKI